MGKRKLTREYCEKVVSTCTSKQELREKHPSEYHAIYRYGYQDLLNGFADGHKKWTKEACKEAVEDCTTKTELKKKWPGAYMAIDRNGWKDLLDGLVDRRKYVSKETAQKRAQKLTKHTKQKCREAALKCKTQKEFRTKFPKEFKASYTHGWLPEFDWLKKNEPEENVCIYCYEFPAIKTIYIGLTNDPKRRNSDHRRYIERKGKDRSSTVYKFCRENGFDIPDMKILISDLPPENGGENDGRTWEDYYVKKYRAAGWTVLNKAQTGPGGSIGSNATKLSREDCYRLSLDCTSRYEFQQKHPEAYGKSWREGWLSEFEHLKLKITKWTDDLIWKEVYKYNSGAEFHKLSRNAYNAAWSRGMLPEIKAYYEQKEKGLTVVSS